jgi:hypothetical protein
VQILNILFTNTLSLCSSLNFRDQVSHPFKTTGDIFQFLRFLIADEKTKGSALNGIKHCPNSVCPCHPQIFEIFCILKDLLACLYVMRLPCILVTRHQLIFKKSSIFCDTTPCSALDVKRLSRGTCLHLQVRRINQARKQREAHRKQSKSYNVCLIFCVFTCRPTS